MKLPRLVILSIVLLTTMACQLFSNLQAKPGSPIEKGQSGLFDAPANPVNVTLQLENTSVTQMIPAQGGTLTATGTDGTRYTLTIPEGALLVDTEISMTPVSAVDGLPFSGGLGGAVKLEPSGLTFDQFVTLKIEPVKSIPLDQQVLFGFDQDGKDLHLALPGADSQAVEIRMLHFSGAGLAEGTSDEKAAVYKRMADRVETRLTNELANYLQGLRAGAEPDPAALDAIFEEYYNSVVLSRLKAASAASGTCADAQKAMQTYLEWARQLSLLGGEERVAKAKNVIAEFGPTAAKKCFDEEYKRCALQHQIAGMIPMLLSFERQGELLGALSPSDPGQEDKDWADARTYGRELAVKCFQWDLVFTSSGKFRTGSDGFDSSVKAKIPIRVEGGADNLFNLKLTGTSALINENFELIDTFDDCDVTNHPGGGEFTVEAFGWEPELRQDSDGVARFYVKDFILKYYPGNTSESITMVCWDNEGKKYPPVNIPPSPWWTGTYVMTHYKDTRSAAEGQPPAAINMDDLMSGASPSMNTGETYVAKEWTVTPAQTIGVKEWDLVSDLDGGVSETGEFQLIHTPQ